MTAASLPQSTFERILRPHLKSLSTGAVLHPDANLAEAGLDAMGAVDLIVQLEEELAMSIPDAMVDTESLQTLRGLRDLVGRLKRDVSG